MEDTIAYILKLLIVVISVLRLRRGHMDAVPIMMIAFFMTGVEMITDSEYPWAYLLSSAATSGDYEKAMLGGVAGVFTFCAILVVIWSSLLSISKRYSAQRGTSKDQDVF